MEEGGAEGGPEDGGCEIVEWVRDRDAIASDSERAARTRPIGDAAADAASDERRAIGAFWLQTPIVALPLPSMGVPRLPRALLRATAAALAGAPLLLLAPAPPSTPRSAPPLLAPLANLLPPARSLSLEEELQRAVEEAFRDEGTSSPPAPRRPASSRPSPSPSPSPSPPPPPSALSAAAAAQDTVWRLVLANSVVWAAWQLPHAPTQRVLERWFLSSPVILGAGFPRGPASALLSTYSHSSFLHLAANMAGLLSFGPRVMAQRGSQRTPRLSPAEFLALYTAAGVGASAASSLFMAALGSARPALGASGSIFGVLTYYTLCAPDSRVLLLFVFEMSATSALWAATAVNAALCAAEWRASRLGRQGPMIDGMAHLVGTAVGAAGYGLARERSRRRGEPEAPTPGARVARKLGEHHHPVEV
jgi:membrane associated rhomboid family serine protease